MIRDFQQSENLIVLQVQESGVHFFIGRQAFNNTVKLSVKKFVKKIGYNNLVERESFYPAYKRNSKWKTSLWGST